MSDLKVLTYGVGLDGFFRVAVKLPNINGKQSISISGTDLGAPFETNDSIIVCSSVHVDASPNLITVKNGRFSSDKISVRLSTYDFTPNEIFAFLGSVRGTDCENTIILPENEINDFKIVRNGRQNVFIFDWPQGDKILSDVMNPLNVFSMSQPLMIGMKVEGEDFRVINYEQLSARNMITNFSTPIKFINANTVKNNSGQIVGGFNFVINGISGSNDVAGMVSLDLKIEKYGGFGVSGEPSLAPSLTVLENETKRTSLTFNNKKYKIDNPNGESSFLTEDNYIENYEFDLLSRGVVYIKEDDKSYQIASSTTSVGFTNTVVSVNSDITNEVIRQDGSFKDVLIADFLPTHCRLHSDRGHVSKEIKLNIQEYNKVNGFVDKIEFIPGDEEGNKELLRGSIIDNGRLFLELINKLTGDSFIKEIDTLDRREINIPINSSLFGGYYVDVGFFIFFDKQSEIFWNPIKNAPDGTLGVPAATIEEVLLDLENPFTESGERNPHNKIYMRIESNRQIQTVTGEISIGSNRITFNTETDSSSNISLKTKNVAWREIDFDVDISVVPEDVVSLPIKYDMTVYDINGNPFKLKL